MSETSGMVEFLLARIAEDEAAANSAGPDGGPWHARYPDMPENHMYGEFGWIVSGPDVETEDSEWGKAVADHIAVHDPARVLAECEAKRRIVELRATTAYHVEQFAHAAPDDPFRVVYTTSLNTYDAVLRSLIMPYADHPDYDPAWT